MAKARPSPRENQRLRTRKDLLSAAARLLQEGRTPTMEEVASEAMVSRATLYRYFPTLDALLVEAPLEGAVPAPMDPHEGSTDPIERLDRAEKELHDMSYRNEASLRALMIHSLKQGLVEGRHDVPVRQNRRTPIIEAALAPIRDQLDDATYSRLCAALALVFGLESMLVFRDVVPLSQAEARSVKSWTLGALVRAALESSKRSRKKGER